MPKTIALQSGSQELAVLLREKGYKVVDMYEAKRPGLRIDAYLYTSYHPGIFSDFQSSVEEADITLGYISLEHHHDTSPLMLNITGMSASHALSTLEHRLTFRDQH